MLLNKVTITATMPCLADPAKIRFLADFDADVTEVLPYLNAVIEAAIYNPEAPALTVNEKGTLITIHPKGLAAAAVDGDEHAKRIIEWVKARVNDCDEGRGRIVPLFEHRNAPKALDVYRMLPGTNCGKCGDAACLAFAVKLVSRQKGVMQCPELFKAEFEGKRGLLLGYLKAVGHPVPDPFVR
jgi:ArsR family metal-binding transcriptional regulator